MGVIKRGILGGFQNKVANIVGSSWKGIAVIKSLPLSVANPNTAAQQTQRNKFSSAVEFAGAILTTIVKPLWDRFAQQMSGYNAFIQANIDQFSNVGLATPAGLITSRGSLVGVENLAATRNSGTKVITISWDDNSGTGNASSTDEAYILIYDVTQQKVLQSGPGVARGDEGVVTGALDWEVADVIAVYVAFRTTNGFLVSNSSYFNVPEDI
jgi:hypothetical protein